MRRQPDTELIGQIEERGAEGQLQKITDRHIAEVDEHLKNKEAELSEV